MKTELDILKEKVEKYQQSLNEVLGWCQIDRDNEDGYPTQEMLDNRVEMLEKVLKD